MTGKGKFTLTLIAVFMSFIAIEVGSLLLHRETIRSEKSLLNQYYRLNKYHPDEQKISLNHILKKYPYNLEANRELGYWYIRNKQPDLAIQQLRKYLGMNPNDSKVAYDLAKLYADKKDYTRAEALLQMVATSKDSQTSKLAQRTLDKLHNSTELATSAATIQLDKSTITRIKEAVFPFIATPKSKLELALGKTQADLPLVMIDRKSALLSTPPTTAAVTTTAATSPTRVNSPSTPISGAANPATVITERDKLLNVFYNNKKTNPAMAWASLNTLLKKYPDDVTALKEAGYYQLNLHHDKKAVNYFIRAYYLTNDPYIALQCGYILSNLHDDKMAYRYFYYASSSQDKAQKLQAELALTNLRYIAFKFIPDPYYAEVYYNPFYQSRFKLFVESLVVRTGVVLSKDYMWQAYLSYRRTQDNKSGQTGVISQIFNDNAAITSIGTSIQPIHHVPFVAFIEGGKAVDLVYRQRSRWRNDFRTGMAFFTEWGNEARYTFTPTIPLKFKGDVYADAIYYSRYVNTIASLRIRPALEILRYETSSLSVYFKTNIIEDRNREFFNNILEYGPGIVLVPSDRYNVALRFESLSGHYLPANSESPNPYSQNYHNGLTQLDVYFRF